MLAVKVDASDTASNDDDVCDYDINIEIVPPIDT